MAMFKNTGKSRFLLDLNPVGIFNITLENTVVFDNMGHPYLLLPICTSSFLNSIFKQTIFNNTDWSCSPLCSFSALFYVKSWVQLFLLVSVSIWLTNSSTKVPNTCTNWTTCSKMFRGGIIIKIYSNIVENA